MLCNVSKLTGAALDYAVAKCEGYDCQFDDEVTGPWLIPQEGYFHDEKPLARYTPSTDWAQGGPIIELEVGNLWKHNKLDPSEPDCWTAIAYCPGPGGVTIYHKDGPTPLIAAMRCYVVSKVGDTIEIPEELV